MFTGLAVSADLIFKEIKRQFELFVGLIEIVLVGIFLK